MSRSLKDGVLTPGDDVALTLQLRSALPQHVRKVFQVVPGGDAELSNKIPCSPLQVSVISVFVGLWDVILGSAEVGITADGSGAFEALQTLLGLALGGWVEVVTAEEFVRRDAFLGAKFLAGILLVVIWIGNEPCL